jgi:hypothetical protein
LHQGPKVACCLHDEAEYMTASVPIHALPACTLTLAAGPYMSQISILGGKIRTPGISNSMTYRHPNSRKSKFATEPDRLRAGVQLQPQPHGMALGVHAHVREPRLHQCVNHQDIEFTEVACLSLQIPAPQPVEHPTGHRPGNQSRNQTRDDTIPIHCTTSPMKCPRIVSTAFEHETAISCMRHGR